MPNSSTPECPVNSRKSNGMQNLPAVHCAKHSRPQQTAKQCCNRPEQPPARQPKAGRMDAVCNNNWRAHVIYMRKRARRLTPHVPVSRVSVACERKPLPRLLGQPVTPRHKRC